ncbi:MAG: hypothetical protein ABIW96_03250 [Polaromonas sp.]
MSQTAFDYINTQKMSRFVFRNVVSATPATGQVTREQAAKRWF